MPMYNFKCKVCEADAEFALPINTAPSVGLSVPITKEMSGEDDSSCVNCGANIWTRVWPSKISGGFKLNMRRTSIL